MDNPLIIIVIAAVFAVLVLGLGLVIGLTVGKRRRKTDAPEQPAPARAVPKEGVEILSIWRNEQTGKLRAIMDGKPLSPARMTEEQKERLKHILTGIYRLMGESPASKRAVPGAVPPKEKPAPAASEEKPAPAASPEQPTQPEEMRPRKDEEKAAETVMEEQQPPREEAGAPIHAPPTLFSESLPKAPRLRDVITSNPFRPPSLSAQEEKSLLSLSIVEQIDEILQEKLAGSPLAHKEIRLKEIPGGMAVLVGMERYNSLDEVPDPEIRALIKAAAREWNERASRRR